jgi:hypothetical protein
LLVKGSYGFKILCGFDNIKHKRTPFAWTGPDFRLSDLNDFFLVLPGTPETAAPTALAIPVLAAALLTQRAVSHSL